MPCQVVFRYASSRRSAGGLVGVKGAVYRARTHDNAFYQGQDSRSSGAGTAGWPHHGCQPYAAACGSASLQSRSRAGVTWCPALAMALHTRPSRTAVQAA